MHCVWSGLSLILKKIMKILYISKILAKDFCSLELLNIIMYPRILSLSNYLSHKTLIFYVSFILQSKLTCMYWFLHGKSHGQRSLAGYSQWGHKDSDMTECVHIHTHWLQYSCICIKTIRLAFLAGSTHWIFFLFLTG